MRDFLNLSQKLKAAGVVALTCLGTFAVASSPAKADSTLSFSYDDGVHTAISGFFEGTLSGDYYTVTSLVSLSVNGVADPGFVPNLLESYDFASKLGGGHNGDGTPVITLDGSYMDLIASPDGGQDGFGFIAGDLAQSVTTQPIYATNGGLFGLTEAAFIAADWTASIVDAPEPMTVALFAVALPGLIAVRRRRSV